MREPNPRYKVRTPCRLRESVTLIVDGAVRGQALQSPFALARALPAPVVAGIHLPGDLPGHADRAAGHVRRQRGAHAAEPAVCVWGRPGLRPGDVPLPGVAAGVVPVAGADAFRGHATAAALAAVRLRRGAGLLPVRDQPAPDLPRQPQGDLAGDPALPVRVATGGVHVYLAAGTMGAVRVWPAAGLRPALRGGIRAGVLERVQRALQ